jgi:acetyltransferase-like isoleucine patch superfamily enzyme
MAEGSKTGSNATLMPGVRVGPDSIVGTGVTLHRDLPPGKMAVLRQQYGVLNNRFAKSDE